MHSSSHRVPKTICCQSVVSSIGYKTRIICIRVATVKPFYITITISAKRFKKAEPYWRQQAYDRCYTLCYATGAFVYDSLTTYCNENYIPKRTDIRLADDSGIWVSEHESCAVELHW